MPDKVLKTTFTETQLLRSRAPHTEAGAFVRQKEGKGGRSRGGKKEGDRVHLLPRERMKERFTRV